MPDALELLTQSPLAMAPKYLGYMLAVLQGRTEALPPRVPQLRGQRLAGTAVIDGIAVVPLVGPILHRADMFDAFGAVSANSVRATIGAAIEDPGVEGVLLVVDSPGGQVAGIADVADALYGARGRKPMLAVADEGIFSGAYWLASAIGPIALPRTGSVGSIGALIVHQDVSDMLNQLGVKITVIKSGDRKAMFSPFQPLSEDARAELQTEVNRIADLFMNAVAEYRGLSTDLLASYQGGTFEGPGAVAAGLADDVNTVEGTFLALKMSLQSTPPRRAQASVFVPSHVATLGVVRDERTPAMSIDTKLPEIPGMTAENPPLGAVLPGSKPGTPAVPAPGDTPWHGATNVVNIETARRQAREEAAVTERKRAAEIMHWCAFAGKADLAESYMESNMTIEQVRNDLLSQTAAAGFEIHAQRPGGGSYGSGRTFLSIDEIYERRREAVKEARLNRRMI